MAWNGAGTFLLDPAYSPEINGTVIDAVRYNGLTADIAAGITVALTKNGQNSATANIPFGGFKATGLGAATSAGDATRFEQVYIRGETNIATAATCSIFALTETTLNLTGVTTVTSFGAGTAGDLKFCTAVAAFQITYDAVNLITPGLTNLAIAAGDWFMVKSKGGSAAEVVQLTRRASLTTRLSDLGSAAAANTIANGLHKQTWGWSGSFNPGDIAFALTVTSVSSYGTLLDIQGNTPYLINVRPNSGHSGSFYISADGVFYANGGTLTGLGNAHASSIFAQSAAATSNGNGGQLNLASGAGDGTGISGNVVITAAGGGVQGGSVQLQAGSGTTPGDVLLQASTGANGSLTINNTATTFAGNTKLVFNQRHEYYDNTNGTPTLGGTGGGGATISGCDTAMLFIAGTGSPTTVTITFANAWAVAPDIVTYGCTQAGVTISHSSPSTTSFILSFSAGLSSGTRIPIRVSGLQ